MNLLPNMLTPTAKFYDLLAEAYAATTELCAVCLESLDECDPHDYHHPGCPARPSAAEGENCDCLTDQYCHPDCCPTCQDVTP